MAAPTNEERLKAVHEEALREFDRVQSALRDERMQCLQDRRFYSIAGAQWEGQLGEQFENRPRLEFNKTHLAVIRIINEYRNNRVTVDFTPKDGTSRADLADTCDGLYRADELDSGAEEAYDNCFEEGVGGGFGAARVRADYEDEYDEDNDQQRIRIEPIFDADTSVYFDLDAKRQDKADAKRCWVLYSMTKEAFVDEFDHDPVGIEKTTRGGTDGFEWVQNDMVFVAEYYRVEQTTELVHWFRGLVEDEPDMRVRDAELTDEKRHFLESTGFREVRQKRVKVRKVRKYIMSGDRIESDEGYIAGKCIPVIPFYGKRWFVDNIERCMGHVRLAKDAQRLQNSLLTWLTEIAAKFNTEKLILTPEQVGPYAQMWADDNTENFPFLYVQSMKDALGNVLAPTQPPKTIAPSVPPAMAALVEIATQALNDLLGNQQAGEEMQPNISGKTVELIQQRLDMQVFIYMSNFAKFVKRLGEVWLSMAKEIYVEEGRQMKTITPDGEPGTVTLHDPTLDEKTGEHYAGQQHGRGDLRRARRRRALELQQAPGNRARPHQPGQHLRRPRAAERAALGRHHEHGRRGPAGRPQLLPQAARHAGRREADRRGSAGDGAGEGEPAARPADAVGHGCREPGERPGADGAGEVRRHPRGRRPEEGPDRPGRGADREDHRRDARRARRPARQHFRCDRPGREPIGWLHSIDCMHHCCVIHL
jgi:hypothetical protein